MEEVVVGKFQAREYETNDGTKRTSLEIAVNFGSGVVAPVIGAFQAVEVTRKQRDGDSAAKSQGNGSWSNQPAHSGGHDWASAPAADNEPLF
jgi:single-stranded DNA-binding protein